MKKTLHLNNNNIAAFAVLYSRRRRFDTKSNVVARRRESRTTARAALAEVVEPATQLHARANTHARLTHTSRRCMHCAVRADARTLQLPSQVPPSLYVPLPSRRFARALASSPVPLSAYLFSPHTHRTRIRGVIAVIDFPPRLSASPLYP